MNWTTPADLHAQVQKLWDKGLLPASLVDGDSLFPRRLQLKGPSSGELADRFEEVRNWISVLRQSMHYRVVMREIRHRILGANLVPDEIWIDSLDDALSLIGKQRDAKRFRALATLTRECQPALLPWLTQYPLKALSLSDDWARLLDIVAWMESHPRPGIYIRQIDLPGIHSKFIETHRAVLSELLDVVLPADSIDRQANGAGRFCKRYGFLDKPLRIRFRMLDPALALLPVGNQDIAVNHDSFALLEPKAKRVFITENEINFLAFPDVTGSMVIFGAGYGFEMLAQADWLHHRSIHYWGDIDTHGFAILDQLRAVFPHAESLLMDRDTLMAHETLWGNELQPLRRDLPRLNGDENALYDTLRDNRIRNGLRLEQERIGYHWVRATLEKLKEPG
jgi:hypothetical protein